MTVTFKNIRLSSSDHKIHDPGPPLEPPPSWPVWDVELRYANGGWAQESIHCVAPTPAAARALADETLAGTGLVASKNVKPARLHERHPRWMATEAWRREMARQAGPRP